MRVMIQLREDAAMELRNQSGPQGSASQKGAATKRLLAETAKLGVSIEPVHPGQTHPLLVPYYMIEAPDRKTADRIISRLKRFDIVEAAYIKPEEQLP
jgi:hypothetical protein